SFFGCGKTRVLPPFLKTWWEPRTRRRTQPSRSSRRLMSWLLVSMIVRRHASAQLLLQQPFRVPDIDLAPVCLAQAQPVDHLDGRLDRPERGVGGEHDLVGTEELQPAGDAVLSAEHRGVGIEIAEIVEMRPLQ